MDRLKKEILIIFIGVLFFALLFFVGFWLGQKQAKKPGFSKLNEAKEYQNQKTSKQEIRKICFYRKQEATESAPYQTEEFISIDILENKVSGSKRGFQKGPDMNNGYMGNLNGTISNNQIEVLFSYEIEGSKNQELELYDLKENTLVKKRYILEEKDGVLKPNLNTKPTFITYNQEDCK